MKRILTATVLICAVAFLAVGCNLGLTEDKLVGKYEGKITLGAEDKKKLEGNAMAAQMAESMKIPLELKKDKTFSMTLAIIPMEGTWKLDGTNVRLTPKTIMGQDAKTLDKSGKAAEDMVGAASPDAKTITVTGSKMTASSGSGGGSIVFTRQAP